MTPQPNNDGKEQVVKFFDKREGAIMTAVFLRRAPSERTLLRILREYGNKTWVYGPKGIWNLSAIYA